MVNFLRQRLSNSFAKLHFSLLGVLLFTTPHTFVSIAATIAKQKRIKLKGFP
jgi:hypothetical protein